MDITVTGRRMNVSDALRDYAEEKIGNSMKAMDIAPLSAEVVLQVEKNPANPTPCTCEVTMHAKGHIIRVEENEESSSLPSTLQLLKCFASCANTRRACSTSA